MVHEVVPVEPGCPWESWARPNIKWCEDNLCAWVTTPANTWSNVAYVVVGVAMLWESYRCGQHKSKRPRERTVSHLGLASIVVGVTSFLFHMSYTAVFQFADFFGMYVLGSIPLTFNLRRLGKLRAKHQVLAAAGMVTVLSLFTILGMILKFYYQFLVVLVILAALGMELWLFIKHRKDDPDLRTRPRLTHFLIFVALLVAAFVCSLLDQANVWCDPDSHLIQGHATWHVITAVSFWFLYKFYNQFDLDSNAPVLPLRDAVAVSAGEQDTRQGGGDALLPAAPGAQVGAANSAVV